VKHSHRSFERSLGRITPRWNIWLWAGITYDDFVTIVQRQLAVQAKREAEAILDAFSADDLGRKTWVTRREVYGRSAFVGATVKW
jgi:hypothetical protein